MDYYGQGVTCPIERSIWGDRAFKRICKALSEPVNRETYECFLLYLGDKDQMDLQREPFEIEALQYIVWEYNVWKIQNESKSESESELCDAFQNGLQVSQTSG
ncbi:MAG: hypothetical protein M1839_005364 [Geoglossum umbratile]|nr:MAG: hypothetical protein M1839_005364 [Geoglossum umbratile]